MNTELTAFLERADVAAWTGLPEVDLHDLGVDPAAARSEWGVRGEPPRPGRCYTVAAGCFEEGARCWAAASGVVETIEGMLPAASDGTLPLAPDLGEPALRLDLAFDELVLSGGELVYPQRGLAVRMNPENGILLGLVGFAPTTVENYCRVLRPVAEIPHPLTTGKTR